jgi:hypothetical protein
MLCSCAAPGKPTATEADVRASIPAEPRASLEAPSEPAPSERPAFADITLFAGEQTFTFAQACEGYVDEAGGLAFGGAALKPKRPPHLWVTGCNGTVGYFHAIIERPPTPGFARSSLFLVTLPGKEQVEIERAQFEITVATPQRLAGQFAFELPDGEPIHGHFDVPCLADDTTPFP